MEKQINQTKPNHETILTRTVGNINRRKGSRNNINYYGIQLY